MAGRWVNTPSKIRSTARARTICISMLYKHTYLYISLYRYGLLSYSPPSNHSLRQRIYYIRIIHYIGSIYYCIKSFATSTPSTPSTTSTASTASTVSTPSTTSTTSTASTTSTTSTIFIISTVSKASTVLKAST